MGSQDELANPGDNDLDDNNSKRVEYLVKKIPGKDVKNVKIVHKILKCLISYLIEVQKYFPGSH